MDRYAAKGINVSCRTIHGSAYIYDHRTRQLLKLDPVGTFIWDHINGTRTLREISRICSEAFAGDIGEIEIAVSEFVSDLSKKGVAAFSQEPFEGVMISAC